MHLCLHKCACLFPSSYSGKYSNPRSQQLSALGRDSWEQKCEGIRLIRSSFQEEKIILKRQVAWDDSKIYKIKLTEDMIYTLLFKDLRYVKILKEI